MSIKRRLFYIVKYSFIVYSVYYIVGTLVLRLLKFFIKPDDKLILFSSFGGRKFDDSPKVLYELMLKDKRFGDYKLIWAFTNPDEVELSEDRKIKCDTLNYYVTALKARAWITNSSIERGLSFKGKNTFYFNTWHGTPLKKMGADISIDNQSFKSKAKNCYDVFLVQGEYEADIFSRVFTIEREKIRLIGLPRNDILIQYTNKYQLELREKLGIPVGKKVILYAPTFREYEKTEDLECKLTVPMNLEYWKERLGMDYILLFRAHYEVAKSMEITDDDFVREMSAYPQLEDLMIVSDMLVSDYSSIFFDYSVMHKPMYCFAYDYERYASERGMYFDIRDYISATDNEVDLLSMLTKGNDFEAQEKSNVFQKKYVTAYGLATKLSIDIIAKEMGLFVSVPKQHI